MEARSSRFQKTDGRKHKKVNKLMEYGIRIQARDVDGNKSGVSEDAEAIKLSL